MNTPHTTRKPSICPSFGCVLAAGVLAALLLGSTTAHAQITYSGNATTVADGDWNAEATWGTTKPWTSLGVLIYREVTLATNTMEFPDARPAHTGGFIIGDPSTNENRGAGSLTINAGGVYTGTGTTTIARNIAPLNGSMTGNGTLIVNGGTFSGAGVTVASGTSNTFTGLIRIQNGGTYISSGSTIVGPNASTGQTGNIEVIGSGNSVTFNGYNQRRGTLSLIFDASGITTLQATGNVLFSDPNSQLFIDGSAYTGPAGNILLIQAAGIDTNYGTIVDRATITGFDPAFNPSLMVNDKDLMLVLVPEPQIYAMMFGLLGLAMVLVRRRCRA